MYALLKSSYIYKSSNARLINITRFKVCFNERLFYLTIKYTALKKDYLMVKS